MRKWTLVALAAVVVVALGGYFGLGGRANASASGCEDWVNQTNDRVDTARTLLYPSDRPDAFQGSAQQASQELASLVQDQQGSEPPENAGQLNDDLIEAMSDGAAGLSAGGTTGAIQVTFAKSIVYNADARLVSFVKTC